MLDTRMRPVMSCLVENKYASKHFEKEYGDEYWRVVETTTWMLIGNVTKFINHRVLVEVRVGEEKLSS